MSSKPTKEQIEYYIKMADAELGPECCDDWVEKIKKYLRVWATESSCINGHDWIKDNTFLYGEHERCSRKGCKIIREFVTPDCLHEPHKKPILNGKEDGWYFKCRHCNKESRFMYERRTNFNGDEYINIFA